MLEEGGRAGGYGLPYHEEGLDNIGSEAVAQARHRRKSSGSDATLSSKLSPSSVSVAPASSKLRTSSVSVAPASQVDSDSDPDEPLIYRLRRPISSSDKVSGIKRGSGDKQREQASSSVANGSASQSRPVGLNGQPDKRPRIKN